MSFGETRTAIAVTQLRLQERGESIERLHATTQESARSAESFASQARMLNDQIDNEEDWFEMCCGCIFKEEDDLR